MKPRRGEAPHTSREPEGPDCNRADERKPAEHSNQAEPARGTPWLELSAADLERASRLVSVRLRASREEAFDAVVDALIKLNERGARADDPTAYLATTAVNVLRDLWKRRRERPASAASDADDRPRGVLRSAEALSITQEHGAQVRLAREDETRWRRVTLQRSLDGLPARDREVMMRHYFQGVPLEAMDRERGEKSGTHKLRLHRARNRLRELLKSDPTAWESLLESLRDSPECGEETGRGATR